jgi:uncharacterized ion transporter superfamily protein YfcC
LRGQGEAGRNGGPAGDIRVILTIEPSRIYTRQGADLFVEMPIPFTLALTGGVVELPLVDGEKHKLVIPELTQPNTVLTIRGKGAKVLNRDNYGSIYVKLMVLLVGLVLLIFNTLLYINKSKKAQRAEAKVTPVEEEKEEKVVAKKTVKKTTKTTSKDSGKTTKKTTKKTSKSTKGNNKAAVKDGDVIVVKSLDDDARGFVPVEAGKTQRVWPLVVTFVLLLILVLLAFFPWTSVFEITWFEDATKAFTEFELFGFPLFGKLFGTFNAFGGWMSTDLFMPIIFFILMLSLIYKVSLSEVFEGFGEGAKKALAPAGMVLVIYTILVLVTYHPFQLTIYKAVLGITKGFNIITATIVGILAGLFNGDGAYAYQSVLPYFTSVVTNTEIYSSVAVLFQSMYGLTMFVAPTSLVLMSVLTYLDIPFTKWLKAIWKFLLEYFAIIIIVSLILILL